MRSKRTGFCEKTGQERYLRPCVCCRSEGDTKMTSRNLQPRLERREESILPTTEDKVILVQYLESDGRVVSTLEVKVPGVPQPFKKTRRW
jgi:hypothetical protein